VAVTFAPNLRRKVVATTPARETKGLADRVKTFFRQYVIPGQPYFVPWNTDRAVREGFETNPWIYRAVHVIASKSLDLPIVLRQNDGDKGDPLAPELDPTRLLYLLNVEANPWERAKIFRYRLIAQFLLSSRGVFIEVVRTRAGRIGLLSLLDPDKVEIIPTKEILPDGTEKIDPIGTFRITLQGGERTFDYLPRFDPKGSYDSQASSVLWVRSPHPTLMFQGMTPTQAAAMSADMDRAARLYNRRFMDSDGRPGTVIAVKGTATRDTLDVVESRIAGKARIDGPGGVVAIQADGLSIADTSGNPRDTQWAETMDRMRKEVSMTFGVPESILGDASGRTFDNADAEKENFWEDTESPLLAILDDQLDVLTGGYDDSLFLRHDKSGVWVLGRHRRMELDRASAEVDTGKRTINEYRALAGLDEYESPLARVLLIPGGKIIGALNAEDEAAAAKAPILGNRLPAGNVEAQQAAALSGQAGAAIGSLAGVNAANNINNANSLRALPPGDRQPTALAGKDGEPPDLEGKQGGARDRGGRTATVWR
jgi:HK97 family phage portal protein